MSTAEATRSDVAAGEAGTGGHPWRGVVALLLAAAVASAVWGEHADLTRALRLLTSAHPGWLLALAGALVLWSAAWTAVHATASAAVGLPARGELRDLTRTSLAAVALNSAVKSGGMAGLAAFLRRGRRRGLPDADVSAGYLLAATAADAGFVAVLAGGLVVLGADGDLSGADVLAGTLFLLLLGARLGALLLAARHPAALRRVAVLLRRLRSRLTRRPAPDDAWAPADSLAAALRPALSRPARVLLPAAAAAVVDLAGVLMLLAALAAVGGGAQPRLALVAYVSSALFASVGPLPGGLGVVEVGTVAVLVAGGVQLPTATAAVALFRLAEFWLPLAVGGLAWSRIRGGAGRPAPSPRAGVWLRRGSALACLVVGVGGLASALGTHTARPLERGLHPFRQAFLAVEGGHYLLLGSGLVLVLIARALLRGRRAAWTTAVAALGTATAGATALHRPVAVLVAGAATLAVGTSRQAFTARGDSSLARRGLAVLVAGELLVAGYAAVGLYRLDDQFRGGTTAVGSVTGALRLLLMLPVDAEPRTVHAAWLIASVRLATLGVVLVGAGLLVAAVTGGHQSAADRAVVRRLLAEHATSALAHFQLLPDKHWMVTEDGRAFVGYGLSHGTAVALGGPIGAPDAVGPAAEQFLALCRRNGWRPAFHQVGEADLPLLTGLGLVAAKIGEEAVVDVTTFSTEGREHKSLRSALRRCERAGYRVQELPHPLTDDDAARLRVVSDAWSADGRHRERTFTLGQFDVAQLRETPVLAVLDGDGEVQAFTNLLPAYRSEERTFDLMRRRPGSVNGVMELLFVAMIDRARAEGARGLDLGLAPFTGLEDQPGAPATVMRLLYEHGGALFAYAGLRAFKQKWGPRWEARYVVARSAGELPAVAVAVARLGELPRGRWSRLRTVPLRWPVTTAFAAVQLWLMGSGAYDPRVHRELLAAAGSNWELLLHGQLWRLLTSPVVQASPGFVWVNAALGLLAFPLAEARLGGRRTAALFLLGDLVGSVPVLLATRLLAGTGLDAAGQHLRELDGGSSAGTWALLAAVAWTLSGRWRTAALSTVGTVLLAALVLDHALADVQHLVSAAGTVLVLAGLQRRPRRPDGELPGADPVPARDRTPAAAG
ncbi:phosphatidylglycerol lysyltransferase domain-containing protein [Goekera deserti]|uniref:Phosphatidylglycerol lysyltransferase n=1 Tax=Goekera deserti TaxID=2497753 RepID=A0A7K3WCM3_9ACTN|nr:phosphatidylglycerol lysyltransferase domain-containing protein [Goekera deserti]NDI46646.1 DUF2156 domain-containing protein [Goekera deserti]NEL54215.1 DUF2156 domain-containing protein [Goekera deserti]